MQAQGIQTGWTTLDKWSDDVVACVNANHNECVTRRFNADNPVASGVNDAADQASQGEESVGGAGDGGAPVLESGWGKLDRWAAQVAAVIDSNEAECAAGTARGGNACPELTTGWKKLDTWAAKLAKVIDANHNECVRLPVLGIIPTEALDDEVAGGGEECECVVANLSDTYYVTSDFFAGTATIVSDLVGETCLDLQWNGLNEDETCAVGLDFNSPEATQWQLGFDNGVETPTLYKVAGSGPGGSCDISTPVGHYEGDGYSADVTE